jgi:transposase
LSAYKDFKHYYLYGIGVEHRDKFGKIPCYQRFVSLKKSLFVPLTILLNTLKVQETGIYFADSTSLKVCHNKRISRHKTFDGLATCGKSTMGWFYGLKLHLILNHQGDIMAVKITPGNTDDRKALKSMSNSLKGKCYADKGYLGKKIFQTLWRKELHLITGIRKNRKQSLMPYIDKVLLRKRFIIETTFGVLKTSMALEHTRHRSATNAFVHILSTLAAYTFKKMNLKLRLISCILKRYSYNEEDSISH